MLSRVADSLYWTSRHIERIENVARMISVNASLTLDLPPETDHWRPLVEAMGGAPAFDAAYPLSNAANVVRFLTYDTENSDSIASSVSVARSNAQSVREFITFEMWEQINRLYRTIVEGSGSGRNSGQFYGDVIRSCQLINGITDATMSHNEGWHFFRIGRKIERADKTSRMLDVRYLFSLPEDHAKVRPYEGILWAALLRSTSALQMYRQRHHQITPERLLDFLVLDREFPRSIRHCVAAVEEAVRAISGTPEWTFQNRAEQVIGRLRAYLEYMNVDEILTQGVHEFIDSLQIRLNEAAAVILETFCETRTPA